jgi:hypothetical protein
MLFIGRAAIGPANLTRETPLDARLDGTSPHLHDRATGQSAGWVDDDAAIHVRNRDGDPARRLQLQ